MTITDIVIPLTLSKKTTTNGEFVLKQRGEPVFELIVDGMFLMASDNQTSAKELAYRSLAEICDNGSLSVLICGFGLGYTLAAVLEDPRVAKVVMVEIEPVIIEWANELFWEIHNDALNDPRVNLVYDDIVNYVTTCEINYDTILLDVDNGPTWLVYESNARLYQKAVLNKLSNMLHPGGILGIWGSEPSAEFLSGLRSVFHEANEHIAADIVNERELEHVIYVAKK